MDLPASNTLASREQEFKLSSAEFQISLNFCFWIKGSPIVALVSIKLTILLPQLLSWWYYNHGPRLIFLLSISNNIFNMSGILLNLILKKLASGNYSWGCGFIFVPFISCPWSLLELGSSISVTVKGLSCPGHTVLSHSVPALAWSPPYPALTGDILFLLYKPLGEG